MSVSVVLDTSVVVWSTVVATVVGITYSRVRIYQVKSIHPSLRGSSLQRLPKQDGLQGTFGPRLVTSEAKQRCRPHLTAHDAQKRTEMIKTYRCDGLPARHRVAYTPNGRGAGWLSGWCRSAWWRLVRWVAACGIIAASRAAWASSDCRSATCDGVNFCGVDSTDLVINGQGVISHRRGDRADIVG